MIKKFENFNNLPKSLDSYELYNKLKILFNPDYLVDRPSGHDLENIEISFNKNTHYADIKDIIDEANWYVHRINGGERSNINNENIRKIEIKPIYSKSILKNIPKKLYHITPKKNLDSILEYGLICKNNFKLGLRYPPRIYLSSDIVGLKRISKELITYNDEKECVLLEISAKKLDIDYLYIDYSVNQSFTNPTMFYIQNVNIPKELIKIKEIFSV